MTPADRPSEHLATGDIAAAPRAVNAMAEFGSASLDLLKRVQAFKPLAAGGDKTPLELKVKRITTVMIWISCAIALLAVLLALPVFFWDGLRSSTAYKYAVLGLLALAEAGWITAMLVELGTGLWILRLAGTWMSRREWLEAQHDFGQIAQLLEYESDVIEEVMEWLAMEIERMRGRISFFFGSVDKVAIFSLLGVGMGFWPLLSTLPANTSINTSLNTGVTIWGPIALGVPLAIVAGSLTTRIRLTRLSYHKDLLGLALRRVRKNSQARSDQSTAG